MDSSLEGDTEPAPVDLKVTYLFDRKSVTDCIDNGYIVEGKKLTSENQLKRQNYAFSVSLKFTYLPDGYIPLKTMVVFILFRYAKAIIYDCSLSQVDIDNNLPVIQLEIPPQERANESMKGVFFCYDDNYPIVYRVLEVLFCSINYPFKKNRENSSYNLCDLINYFVDYCSVEILQCFLMMVKLTNDAFDPEKDTINPDISISFTLTNLNDSISLLMFSFTFYKKNGKKITNSRLRYSDNRKTLYDKYIVRKNTKKPGLSIQ